MKALMGMVFVLPAFVFVLAFMIYPLAYSFYISLCDYNFVFDMAPVFAGLKNYIEAFEDEVFLLSMKNTFVFAGLYFAIVMTLSFLIALALFYYKGKSGLARTCIFLPIVVPISFAAILFNWIFQQNYGLLNFLIAKLLGAPYSYGWLIDRNTAMLAIVIVTVWSSVGFETILYLAGMQSISEDVLDAAKIDGAGVPRTIFRIIIPNLRDTFFITGIWATLHGLKVFVQPNVITVGGPGNATRVMYMQIYDNAFEMFEMGYAAALGFILCMIILAISFVNYKVTSTGDR